jgi:hypothetical protein
VPLVPLVVAIAAIVVGMIVVAVGRGGEMTEFSADVRPVDTDIATAADVALLRPPVALWGYDRRSTDEALNVVARTVTERDVEIAALRRQIADMQSARAAAAPWQPEAATHLEGTWRPRAAAGADGPAWPGAAAGPDVAAWPADAAEPGQATPPGQTVPGSQPAAFERTEASPSPPPTETEPWSAWERPAPEPPPDSGEPAKPGETG